jgi:hypothetical protein
MTFQESYQLRKSYNQDLTPIKEIDRINKELQILKERYNLFCDSWDYKKVEEWYLAVSYKKGYLKYLENLT